MRLPSLITSKESNERYHMTWDYPCVGSVLTTQSWSHGIAMRSQCTGMLGQMRYTWITTVPLQTQDQLGSRTFMTVLEVIKAV